MPHLDVRTQRFSKETTCEVYLEHFKVPGWHKEKSSHTNSGINKTGLTKGKSL
jgi:hypothetical protein